MAFSLTFTLGRLLGRNEKLTTAKLNAIIKGIAATFTGTVGHADINPGAVQPDLVTPGAYSYIGASLSGATYSGTWAPAVSGYADGLWLAFKADTANTGAANLNANGNGAKPLRKWGGQALETGDIVAGQIVTVRYNTTIVGGGCFEMVGLLGQPYPDGYRFGTSVFDGVNKYVITVPDRVSAYTGGLTIAFYADAANLGGTTVNVNGLGITNLWANRNGVGLAAGEIKANQLVVMEYDGHGGFQMVSPRATIYTPSEQVVAEARNLLVKNGASALNQAVVTADELVLKDATGKTFLASAVNVTVDIAVSQNVNGRDTATAEAASTWYFVWIISDGTTVASVISQSSAAATVETNLRASSNFDGYTYKALVAAVHNGIVGGVTTDFPTFQQLERDCFVLGQTLFTGKAGVTTLTALSGADLTALQAIVPPVAKSFRGWAGTSTTNSRSVMVSTDANGLGSVLCSSSATNLVSNENGSAYTLPVVGGAVGLYWKAPDTSALYAIAVNGFRI